MVKTRAPKIIQEKGNEYKIKETLINIGSVLDKNKDRISYLLTNNNAFYRYCILSIESLTSVMKLLNISWDRLRELENKTVIETLFGALIVGKSTGVLEINNVSTKLESRIKGAIVKKDPVILRELSIEELNKILDRSVETKMMFSLAADTFISLARDMHKIMGNNLTNSSAANIFATILVVFFEYPEIIKIYN